MPTVALSPQPKFRVPTLSGAGESGGKLYTFYAGSSVKAPTYTDATGTALNTNPVVLNLRGECDLWLDDAITYKLVAKDASGATIWTADNITGAGGGGPGGDTYVSGTESIGVVGSGTSIDPYELSLNVSADLGNLATIRADGLFVQDNDGQVKVSENDALNYLEQKIIAGSGVTVTKLTNPQGEYLQLTATGAAQWETVTIGGADYLTPVSGLPQFITSVIQHASAQVVVGAAIGVAGDSSGLSATQLNLFNQASTGTVGIALSDDGSALLSTSVGPLLLEAPTGQYIKADVGGVVSDTLGRIVNAGSQVVLSSTEYDGLGAVTSYGSLSIDPSQASLVFNDGTNKFLTVNENGVVPFLNTGVNSGAVITIDGITGALQSGQLDAADVGADPAGTAAGLVANYVPLAGTSAITGNLGGTTAAKSLVFFADTNAASDDHAIVLRATNATSSISSRSAQVQVHGINHATLPGALYLDAALSGEVRIRAGTSGLSTKIKITPGSGTVAAIEIGATSSDTLDIKAATTVSPLAGTGTRMVTASSTGLLSTATIPGTPVVETTAGNLTVGATTTHVYYTGTGGHTITFPTASASAPRVIIVDHAGSGTLTLDNASDTFQGAGSYSMSAGDALDWYSAANNVWRKS